MQSASCALCNSAVLGGGPGIPTLHLFVRVVLWGSDNMRGNIRLIAARPALAPLSECVLTVPRLSAHARSASALPSFSS